MLGDEENGRLLESAQPSLRRVGVSAFVYMWLIFMCMGMLFGPVATMFLNRACSEVGLSSDRCKDKVDGIKIADYDKAQSHATASLTGWTLALGAAQFCVCPLMGILGDARGRRVPLVLPLIGGFLTALALAFVPAGRQNDLLVGVTFAVNVLGGQYVGGHACFSSLADVTQSATLQTRAFVFGAVEIGLWLGMIIGPLAGGLLTRFIGYHWTYLVICCVAILNLIITLLTYPETHEPARRVPVEFTRANPFSSLKMFVEGGRTTTLLGIAELCALVGTTGGATVIPLYAAKWANASTTSGVFVISVVAIAGCFGLVFVLPCLAKRIPLQYILALALLNIAVCWLASSMMTSMMGLLLVAAFQITSACFAPVVRAGVVNTFGSSRYGEALAAVGSMEQLCFVAATQFAAAIYRFTEGDVLHLFGPVNIHSAVFPALSVVALMGAAAAFSVRDMPRHENEVMVHSPRGSVPKGDYCSSPRRSPEPCLPSPTRAMPIQ